MMKIVDTILWQISLTRNWNFFLYVYIHIIIFKLFSLYIDAYICDKMSA